VEDGWSMEDLGVFEGIWWSKAPLKVVAFSWKLLLDRIPTRMNLARRNCLPSVLCGLVEESTSHLFLHCIFTTKVWASVMRWLDFSFITPPNLFVHWACWSNERRNKRIRKGMLIIWHATMWAIWNARNHMIFCNEVSYVDAICLGLICKPVYIMNGVGTRKNVL
jgi:hypothetical protein